MRNLITDVPGVLVGCADDAALASGATVVLFERPAIAALATPGGAPALRDAHLLAPEMTVEAIDAFALSGGSVYGLDTAGGVLRALSRRGRGLVYGGARVPICPGAALFDLVNGGDKRLLAYGELGEAALANAGADFALGTVGAGFGATTCDLKGGLGSASTTTSSGFMIGALAAVNCIGRVTRGTTPHFWAAPYEQGDEFGGLGEGPPAPDRLEFKLKSDASASTTLAVVATDAPFSKAQMQRVAIMASGGFALSFRPAFGPADGDVVFAASTARSPRAPDLRDLAEIGTLAAECLARAVARGVHAARALPFPGAKPAWRDRWGGA